MALKNIGRWLVLAAVLFVLPVLASDETERFVGLGIVIQEKDSSIQIVDLFVDGPAIRAGLRIGDWILAVDGRSTEDQKLKEVSKWLRGEEGTATVLTIKHKDESTSEVSVTRELITIHCYIKGTISLTLLGNVNMGNLSGQVGPHSVYWNVTNGRLYGYHKNRPVNLNVETSSMGEVRVHGWILGSYVEWRGFNNNVYTYQSCIY